MITLQSTTGESKSLEDYRGKLLVLYFYPKDDTPGCTTQACELRDSYQVLKKLGAEVVGVSSDPIDKHQKFIEKNLLPFELLSDPEHKLQDQFGVWGEKSMYGKKYMGTIRSAFVIGDDGEILKSFPKISPKKTVPEVRKFLETLQ